MAAKAQADIVDIVEAEVEVLYWMNDKEWEKEKKKMKKKKNEKTREKEKTTHLLKSDAF